MTNRFLQSLLAAAGMTALICSPANMGAIDSSAATTAPDAAAPAVPSQTSPVQLSRGVLEILKLVRANVSDDTIAAFIKNSRTVYTLSADEIVYLREQGVSDRVVATMLDQRKKVEGSAARTASQKNQAALASAAAIYTEAGSVAYAQPSTTYIETAPAYVSSSSVYVAPYPSSVYVYDDYEPYGWPYYGGYYGYSYPSVSLSFGFGNYCWGGYHGYHGGGYYGGGHHGGGSGGSHGGSVPGGGSHGGGTPGGGSHGGGSPGGGSHGGGRR